MTKEEENNFDSLKMLPLAPRAKKMRQDPHSRKVSKCCMICEFIKGAAAITGVFLPPQTSL